MKIGLFLLFIFMTSSYSMATERLNETILNEYLKLQKEFSLESCKPGTEEAYLQLEKSYKGDGNFIPVLLDDKVDLKTIKALLPLMKEKIQWIQGQIDFLNKNQENKSYELKRIENETNLLLEAKKEYYVASEKEKKENVKIKAQKQFEQLLKEVELLKDNSPYLLSFKFPVNHLALRAEYEKNKFLNTKEARSRANSVYLYRKIVQDGTYDEEFSRNDSVVRAGFDTLYLSLTKESNRSFLTENERVDLQFIVRNFYKLQALKNQTLISRLEEWKQRSERTFDFYQSIAEGKKIKLSEESQIKDITALLEDRARSLYTLKEFVLKREAKVYDFWAKKSELLQALYAIETILYSEVGRIDAPDALERRDVAQVVVNRSENALYNNLSDKDSIKSFITSKSVGYENKWLNVLFKEGEFSFTYFYIPGNFHIYCPDMSKVGQFLRRENVRIALELLNNPRKDFKATRYFSRFSMFGRIEMDSLWGDFKPLEEVPGKMVKNPAKIYDLYKKDRYKFLYSFENEALKKNFLAVELKGKTYVVESDNPKQIYYYRNPHQFKYFVEVK